MFNLFKTNTDVIEEDSFWQSFIVTLPRLFLELMAIFEITFDIEIAYEDVNDIITVQNIIDYIENKQKARDELFKNLF